MSHLFSKVVGCIYNNDYGNQARSQLSVRGGAIATFVGVATTFRHACIKLISFFFFLEGKQELIVPAFEKLYQKVKKKCFTTDFETTFLMIL